MKRTTRESPTLYVYTNNPTVPKVAIGVVLHQWILRGVNREYIHIGVGLCVARFDLQGNSQEPQNVERATVQGFTLSFCLHCTYLYNHSVAVVLDR